MIRRKFCKVEEIRNWCAYRYGFNGKELDPEGMGGGGSTYDYGFRIYNPNIARFLSVDPLTKEYPELTPYQFASNTPIQAIDLDGLEMKKSNIIPMLDDQTYTPPAPVLKKPTPERPKPKPKPESVPQPKESMLEKIDRKYTEFQRNGPFGPEGSAGYADQPVTFTKKDVSNASPAS